MGTEVRNKRDHMSFNCQWSMSSERRTNLARRQIKYQKLKEMKQEEIKRRPVRSQRSQASFSEGLENIYDQKRSGHLGLSGH